MDDLYTIKALIANCEDLVNANYSDKYGAINRFTEQEWLVASNKCLERSRKIVDRNDWLLDENDEYRKTDSFERYATDLYLNNVKSEQLEKSISKMSEKVGGDAVTDKTLKIIWYENQLTHYEIILKTILARIIWKNGEDDGNGVVIGKYRKVKIGYYTFVFDSKLDVPYSVAYNEYPINLRAGIASRLLYKIVSEGFPDNEVDLRKNFIQQNVDTDIAKTVNDINKKLKEIDPSIERHIIGAGTKTYKLNY